MVSSHRHSGCPFGESCHFLHYVHRCYNVVAQMMNLAPTPPPPRNILGLPSNSNGSNSSGTHDNLRAMGPGPGRMGNWMEPHAARPASSFGASCTAKISVDVADHGGQLGAGAGEPSPVPRVLLKLEEDVQNDVVGELREQGSGHWISNLSEK
ncbi:hypothetical protein ACFX2I_007712 [Malus domestica]